MGYHYIIIIIIINMKSFAVLCLLGQIDARRFIDADMLQLESQSQVGLGSLEGAYLAQK